MKKSTIISTAIAMALTLGFSTPEVDTNITDTLAAAKVSATKVSIDNIDTVSISEKHDAYTIIDDTLVKKTTVESASAENTSITSVTATTSITSVVPAITIATAVSNDTEDVDLCHGTSKKVDDLDGEMTKTPEGTAEAKMEETERMMSQFEEDTVSSEEKEVEEEVDDDEVEENDDDEVEDSTSNTTEDSTATDSTEEKTDSTSVEDDITTPSVPKKRPVNGKYVLSMPLDGVEGSVSSNSI